MKAYSSVGGITPLILKLSTRWRHMGIQTPPTLPLNRELHGPQSQSGNFGEQKKFLPILKIAPWIIQPVAQSL
jgi:hypothetical protein